MQESEQAKMLNLVHRIMITIVHSILLPVLCAPRTQQQEFREIYYRAWADEITSWTLHSRGYSSQQPESCLE